MTATEKTNTEKINMDMTDETFDLSYFENLVYDNFDALVFTLEPTFDAEMQQLKTLTKSNTKKARIRASQNKKKQKEKILLNIYERAEKFSSGNKAMIKVKNGRMKNHNHPGYTKMIKKAHSKTLRQIPVDDENITSGGYYKKIS